MLQLHFRLDALNLHMRALHPSHHIKLLPVAALAPDYTYLMQALLARISALREAGRAVILLGDLNISLATIDSCDPGNVEEFNSRQDRRMLTMLLTHNGGPFLDTFRKFYPDRCDAHHVHLSSCPCSRLKH